MIDTIIDDNDLTEENSEPLLIGITGGIGSGKTSVGTLFAQSGYIVLNADNLAKEIMEQNTDIQSKLLSTFGKESILQNGEIDFSFISSIVFAEGNTHLLKELNHIHQILAPNLHLLSYNFRWRDHCFLLLDSIIED